jgi:hypothetical protein
MLLLWGGNFDFIRSKTLNMVIGMQRSYYAADNKLNKAYSKNLLSVEVFIRIYPPCMTMRGMKMNSK